MNCTKCGCIIKVVTSALHWIDSGLRNHGKMILIAVCEDCCEEENK